MRNLKLSLLITIFCMLLVLLLYFLQYVDLLSVSKADVFSYIVTICAILPCLYIFLCKKGKRIVYVSSSMDDKMYAKRLIQALKKSRLLVLSFDDTFPGEDKKEISTYNIKRSSLCFLLIGKNMDARQKVDFHNMKIQGKKVIPVVLPNVTKVPNIIKNIKSMDFDDLMNRLAKSKYL